ncbi:hypothetical protein [Leucobacter musarum]|uniref:hypothetical protein n=1 Tax=Leucobacter musarum TaxID=1930747 RepID=UPI0006A76F8E|nr:hypothetical protein [Leucobacter musarum]
MGPENESQNIPTVSIYFAPPGTELPPVGNLEAAGFTPLGFRSEVTWIDEAHEAFTSFGDAAIKAGEAMKTFSITLSGLKFDALLLSVIFGRKPRRKRDRKRWVALKKVRAKAARDLRRADQRLAIGIKEGSR